MTAHVMRARDIMSREMNLSSIRFHTAPVRLKGGTRAGIESFSVGNTWLSMLFTSYASVLRAVEQLLPTSTRKAIATVNFEHEYPLVQPPTLCPCRTHLPPLLFICHGKVTPSGWDVIVLHINNRLRSCFPALPPLLEPYADAHVGSD